MWPQPEDRPPRWVTLLLTVQSVLGVPQIVMNFLAGAVALVWLLLLREWRILFQGVLAIVCGPWIIGLILSPQMLIGALANKAAKRPATAYLTAGVSLAYGTGVILAWAFISLRHYSSVAAMHSSPLPIILWSYEIASGPWAFLASQDQRMDPQSNSVFHLTFLSLGYITSLLAMWLGGAEMSTVFTILAAFMFVSWCVQMILFKISFTVELEQKRRASGIVRDAI